MSLPTNRESDKFIIRLPDGMRDRIKVAAETNNRSMNAEIVATLEEKYPAPREPSDILFSLYEQAFQLMSEMEANMAEIEKASPDSRRRLWDESARLRSTYGAVFNDINELRVSLGLPKIGEGL